MSNKILWLIIVSLFIAVLACSTREVPAGPEVKKTPESVDISLPKSGWEAEWAKVLKEAKKEGRVVIYGTSKPEAYKAISEGLKKSFGLELETVTGRSAEIVNKVKMETRAGLYLSDINLIGGATSVLELGPLGILIKLDPL